MMAELPVSPTDAAIRRLLAAEPLPTATLAARLGIPARTARHRLYRLRQAGAVATDADGRHHLAAPPLPARGPADSLAAQRLAGPVEPVAGPVGGLAAPPSVGLAPDRQPLTRPAVSLPPAGPAEPSGPGREPVPWLAATVIFVGILGLAMVGWLVVSGRLRRPAPPAPAAPLGPLAGFDQGVYPWGGGAWSW